MILGAVYLLWMLRKVVFGPLREPAAHGHGHDQAGATAHGAIRPVGWHEIAGLAPLMVLIVLIGIYSRAVPRRGSVPSVAAIDRESPGPAGARATERRSPTLPTVPARSEPEPRTASGRSRLERQPRRAVDEPCSSPCETVQQTLADPAAGDPPPAGGDRA